MTEFLGGKKDCATVVGKWIFNRNVPFTLTLTRDNMDYCCTNYYETRVINGYKLVLKKIIFIPTDKTKFQYISQILNYTLP